MCKKILVALVVVLLMLVVPGFAYDKNPGSFKEFPATIGLDYCSYIPEDPYINMETTITKIIVLGTAEGLYPDSENGKVIAKRGVGVFGQEGSGFYIGHGYFVTNAHVVIPSAVSVQLSKWVTWVTTPVKILTLEVFIGQNTALGSCPGTLIWTDYERDLALVKVVGNWVALEAMEYQMGWTRISGEELLTPGTAVATIVAVRENPDDGDLTKTAWFEVRYGTIIDSHAVIPGPLGEGHNMELNLPWFSINDVTTDLAIYPGDSGSPIFAFQNGRPVIVGVARAVVAYCNYYGECWQSSYFTRIDMIIPFTMER